MSIQAECREAMNRLAIRGGVFTEIDVANEASSDAWSNKHFDQAVRDAYNVLQGDYKKGKLVRFGPVSFNGVEDYARRGTKILYTDATRGPQKLETPNGAFPRLMAANDKMAQPGRRAGTNRDDTRPWDGQTITLKRTTPKGPPIDTAPLFKRIQELEEEVRKLRNEGHTIPEPAAAVEHDADAFNKLVKMLTERVKENVAEALIS